MKQEEQALVRTLVNALLGGLAFAIGGAFALGTGAWIWAVQGDNPEYNDVGGGIFLFGAIIGAAFTLPFGAIAGAIFSRTGKYRRGLIATLIVSSILGVLFYSAGVDSQGGDVAPAWILLGVLGGVLAALSFTGMVVRRDESRRDVLA